MSEFLAVLLISYFVGIALGPWLALLVPLTFAVMICWFGWITLGPWPLIFLGLGLLLRHAATPVPHLDNRTPRPAGPPSPRPRLGHA